MTAQELSLKKQSIFQSIQFWMGCSLLVHLITSWFSLGFLHYDEHFQILEFAGMKLGWNSPASLPWEYPAKIRPALQPAMVYGIIKALHLTDSFTITFLLRLISGVFAWAVLWFFTYLVSPMLKSNTAKHYLYLLTCLYGFLSFIHVRFASENWSGSTCFLGIGILLLLWQKASNYSLKNIWLLIAGFCFGLSYVFRMQVAVIPCSLVIWALVFKKINFKNTFFIMLGGIVAVAIGVLADRWFYGTWVNTTFNYFHANIIENKAAHFGIMPWYWFFVSTILGEVPGALNWTMYLHKVEPFSAGSAFSIIVVISFIVFWIRHPKHWLTAITLPFFLLHSLIAHKELRFLFPMINVVPIVVVMVITEFLDARNSLGLKSVKYILSGLLLVLGFLSLNFIFTPYQNDFAAYKFMNNYKDQELYFLGYHKDCYQMKSDLKLLFYKPKGFHVKYIKSMTQVDSLLKQARFPVYFYSGERGFFHPQPLDSIDVSYKMVYCSYPAFLRDININHWQERTSANGIYLLTPKTFRHE